MIATLAASLLLAAAPAPAAPCTVTGTVLDHEGQPVAGVDVHVDDGKAPRHAQTDAKGAFDLGPVDGPTDVAISLREGGSAARFEILTKGNPVTMIEPVDPTRGCRVDARPEAGTELAERFALYQATRRGFALMDRLGIRPGATLHIDVDDPVASPDAAYWVGPPSYNPTDTTPPRIVLGVAASRGDDPGAPDNREYHELGHHALATAFGALPRSSDDLGIPDYHGNPSSTAAWTEGFAIFFAAMVAREIEARAEPSRYRVAGAWLDLELDYHPWDLRGAESVAVASLLWDLVDGPRAAKGPTLEVRTPNVIADDTVPHLLVGRVHNPEATAVLDARVRVSGEGWQGVTPVVPRRLEPGADGWFVVPLPAALGERDDPLAGLSFEAGVQLATPDDESVQVELAALWQAIVELRSGREGSNGRLFDVDDLYQALRGRLGAAVDPVFEAHGLFADADGNRRRAPTERLGLTSHPARTLEIDGRSQTWPAMDPRHRLALPPGLLVHTQTDPPDATLVVVVPTSPSGGYVVSLDAEENFVLVPPPAIEGATVTVVALADGRRPTVLFHRDATALLTELEAHTLPYLAMGARLAAWEGPKEIVIQPSWPRTAFIAGAIAALLGLVLMAIGWPRLR